MSGCSKAQGLYLDLAADRDAEVDDGHVGGCPSCQAAVTRAARFDAALVRASRAITSEAGVEHERRTIMLRRTRSIALAGAVGAVIIVVAVVAATTMGILTGSWRPGDSPGGPARAMPSADPIDRSEPAQQEVRERVVSLTGVPPIQVLDTEDGMAALAYDGSTLHVVLVRVGAEGPEGLVLGSMPLVIDQGAAITSGTVVICPDLDLVRHRYVIGYFQSAKGHGPVKLEGARAIGGAGPDGTYLFALDRRPSDERSDVIVTGDGGKAVFPGSWFERPEQAGARNAAGCFVH